jgi:VanZ family protein
VYYSRGSSFARASLLAYLLLIVYASWFPFSGWRETGISPFAYLMAPLPRYWTVFDVATNVLGYIPLGLLTVLAMYPLIRGKRAALLAIGSGLFLSAVMEAVQTYLPSRVPSNLDLITNVLGTTIGALIGLLSVNSFFGQGRVHRLGQRWFRQEASGILVVLALWPLAQIYPQSYLFGHGQLAATLSAWLSGLLSEPVDLGEILRQAVNLNVEHYWHYWLSETIITACGLTGALLTLLCLLRKSAPWGRLATMLLLFAVAAKSMATALFFAPENAFAWLTPGAIGGLLIGVMMVSGLAYAPALVQRRLAVVALFISFVIVNLVPTNHYFIATLQTWSQGKFLNFNGAAQILAISWPLLALWLLLLPRRGIGSGE